MPVPLAWTKPSRRAIPADMKKGDHLFLIDGSGYIFRAYHALPPLTRKSDGLPVGAVSGFCNMLWKLMLDARNTDVGIVPTHFAVIFDYSSKTFRNDLYPNTRPTARRRRRPDPAIRPDPPGDQGVQPAMHRDRRLGPTISSPPMPKARPARPAATPPSSPPTKDLMQLVGATVGMYGPMKDRQIGIPGSCREVGRAAGEDGRPAGAYG